MKLTVVGSTGHTGAHVVAEGLRRGYQVTAFTRRPEAIPDRSKLAAVVPGDGRDPEAVRTAITGADAVIALVAATSRKGPHHTAEVARTVVDAMRHAGVRRLVFTSAYPIVGRKPRLPITLLRIIFADAYADTTAMERIVTASDLDWSIARLNRLTNGPARGGLTYTRDLLDKPAGMTRADAGAALIDIAEDDTLARTALNLTGTQ